MFIFFYINPSLNLGKRKCIGIMLDVVSNDRIFYFNKFQICSYLDALKLNPLKKYISNVKIKIIEKTLEKYKLIRKASVYKTVDCTIRIKIYQRMPVLRIITNKINCYVDSEKNILHAPIGLAICVPLANGTINSIEYVINQLYPLAIFLSKNKFWNDQIEQIYVNDDLEIELIPRVGNQRIVLGEMRNFENKLNNLIFFYKKVLNVVGWNLYNVINLKYNNQVICTKAN